MKAVIPVTKGGALILALLVECIVFAPLAAAILLSIAFPRPVTRYLTGVVLMLTALTNAERDGITPPGWVEEAAIWAVVIGGAVMMWMEMGG